MGTTAHPALVQVVVLFVPVVVTCRAVAVVLVGLWTWFVGGEVVALHRLLMRSVKVYQI